MCVCLLMNLSVIKMVRSLLIFPEASNALNKTWWQYVIMKRRKMLPLRIDMTHNPNYLDSSHPHFLIIIQQSIRSLFINIQIQALTTMMQGKLKKHQKSTLLLQMRPCIQVDDWISITNEPVFKNLMRRINNLNLNIGRKQQEDIKRLGYKENCNSNSLIAH